MKNNHPEYMTTPKERLSYWTFFVGQNIYYNLTAAFITTYLAMQGIPLAKVGTVLLIVKVWDAVNDPIFGFLFDKIHFKNGQKSLSWLRLTVALFPIVTIGLFSIPGWLSDSAKLWWFGIMYLLWDTLYTLSDVPVYAMLTTMTDNLSERNTLLAMNRVIEQPPKMVRNMLRPTLAALVMAGVVYAIYYPMSKVFSLGSTMDQVILCGVPIVVGVVVYVVCVIKFKAITREDCLLLPKGEKIAKLLRL